MSNHIIIHKASNLAVGITSADPELEDSSQYFFFKANDKLVNAYYRAKGRKPTTLPDFGYLLKLSGSSSNQASSWRCVPEEEQANLYYDDALGQYKAGKTISQIAYALACTEHDVKKLLKLI